MDKVAGILELPYNVEAFSIFVDGCGYTFGGIENIVFLFIDQGCCFPAIMRAGLYCSFFM